MTVRRRLIVHGRVHGVRHVRLGGHVAAQVAGPGTEFRGDPPAPVVLDVGEEHGRALGVHQPGRGLAEPAGGPGDEDDLPGNPSCHGPPTSLSGP